jgi:pyruvate dehydrogenase E1 component alpha subunit
MLEYWERRDPLRRYEAFLLERGIVTRELLEELHRQTLQRMTEAIDAALEQPYPQPEEAFRNVFV